MTRKRKKITPFRRRKGAFDRFISSQVYEDGSKILDQEPTQETIDLRHNWWDPVVGTSPLPPEEAAKKTLEARRLRDRRAARAAARPRCRQAPQRD